MDAAGHPLAFVNLRAARARGDWLGGRFVASALYLMPEGGRVEQGSGRVVLHPDTGAEPKIEIGMQSVRGIEARDGYAGSSLEQRHAPDRE